MLFALPLRAEEPFVRLKTQMIGQDSYSIQVDILQDYRLNTAAPVSERISLQLTAPQQSIDGESFELARTQASLNFASKIRPLGELIILICRGDRCRREVIEVSF